MNARAIAAWVLAGLLLVLGAGCSGEAAKETKEGADGVRDQVTGAAPIQQGRHMKKRLDDINKQRQDQFDKAANGE